MAANIEVFPTPAYAMSGNPFVVSARNTGDADGSLTVRLSRTAQHADSPIFSDSYIIRSGGAVHYFDVGEVVKSAVEMPPLPSTPSDVADVSSAFGNRLFIQVGESFYSWFRPGYGQFPAGELLRRGCSASALLEEKFIAQSTNPGKAIPSPFFSVRSRAYTVSMYEAELMPLHFMSQEDVSLKVFDSAGAQVFSYSRVAASTGAAFYLNLAPLVTPYRKYFKVVFGDNHAQAVHVTLSPNPPARTLRTVTFLNSLGFYEKLLLTGSASRTRSFVSAGGDGEGATRQELAPALQLYRKLGVRRDVEDSITLMAGYSTADRLAVIADMVNSERILLDGEPVICTTGELVTRSDADQTEPREVALTFLLAE